jgi:hypothetical protein
LDIFPDFYRQNTGGSKLTRGSSHFIPLVIWLVLFKL